MKYVTTSENVAFWFNSTNILPKQNARMNATFKVILQAERWHGSICFYSDVSCILEALPSQRPSPAQEKILPLCQPVWQGWRSLRSVEIVKRIPHSPWNLRTEKANIVFFLNKSWLILSINIGISQQVPVGNMGKRMHAQCWTHSNPSVPRTEMDGS